jgi:hypothetical protein
LIDYWIEDCVVQLQCETTEVGQLLEQIIDHLTAEMKPEMKASCEEIMARL